MENLEKMQMIDTIRQTEKFSEESILSVTQEIMNNNLPSAISNSNNTIDVVLSLDKLIQKLLERIDYCKSEISIQQGYVQK